MTPSSSPEPTPGGPSDPRFGFSALGKKANATFLSLSLVAACAALWVSPVGDDVAGTVTDRIPAALGGTSGSTDAAAPAARPTPRPSATPSATPSRRPTTPTASRPSSASVPRPYAGGSADPTAYGRPTGGESSMGGGTGSGSSPGGSTPFVPIADGSESGGGGGAGGGAGAGGGGVVQPPRPGVPPTAVPPAAARIEGCWSFDWQQDAQAHYVADLSDPLGLDSGRGGFDGDGLACTDLPVDAKRPVSEPAGAYVEPAPTPAAKAELLSPAKDYYGFSQDGLPGDTAMFDRLDDQVGKAPSSVGWFSGFNQDYRGDLVTKAWRRDALPVVTWMSVAQVSDPTAEKSAYSLTSIIEGQHDAYLYRYAEAVARTGLPVVIRFDHEMNGSWYGWSSGRADYNNTPEKYVAAWRHLWQVFESVGANEDVIWLWSPSRVDDLKPSATNGLSDLEASYPGDQYVDWVGASIYMRRASLGPTYEAAFGRTVDRLKALTSKPLFFAEIGATQAQGGQELSGQKAEWTRNALRRFVEDDDVVGFLWFNNRADHVVDGVPSSLDWRVDSSPEALAAFREAVADDGFAAGSRP
ncbi:MAG: glycosyl hydrolase [Nocardioidaceae bacterium]|nr:glycosyl hydrolase [Nocardioidaceae bacterium]